jgi:hypothetical protein
MDRYNEHCMELEILLLTERLKLMEVVLDCIGTYIFMLHFSVNIYTMDGCFQ